jgi:Fe-S-cluster-containing dehydrogenase component
MYHCENMIEEFIDPAVGKREPQCIAVCPKEAISLKNVEQIGEETRMNAVKRLFGDIIAESKE